MAERDRAQVNGGLVCWGNADFGGDATAVRSLNHSVVEAWR